MVKKKEVTFATVTDLQDLLNKKGSLPDYVSKEHVCDDIATLLSSNFITRKQKNEVNSYKTFCRSTQHISLQGLSLLKIMHALQ